MDIVIAQIVVVLGHFFAVKEELVVHIHIHGTTTVPLTGTTHFAGTKRRYHKADRCKKEEFFHTKY